MLEPNLNDILSSNGPVEVLELDGAFQQHLQVRGTYDKHRVSLPEIDQVFQLSPKLLVNSSPDGRAPVVMVGPTETGRFLCIPIEPTDKWGVWRPITAFEANAHHREKYREENR